MKTIFMTRAQHEAWDKALRSNEYKQGKYTLRERRDGVYFYCCLGVLEHCLTRQVEDAHAPTLEWLENHGIRFVGGVSTIMAYNVPTLPTLECFASVANDNGRTFVEIADAIAECIEYIEAKTPDAVLENNDKE